MKKYLNAALHKLTVLLEFIISFVLAAGIIILLVQLILSMPNVPDLNIYPNYEDLVETCFNLIIGVELIRMLYQHKPSTVFEVLLFAIASAEAPLTVVNTSGFDLPQTGDHGT